MITIKENKLNLILGKVDSAKTTLIINQMNEQGYFENDKNVIFFSPDTKAHHIEKKIHSLVNDVDISSVKHDRKTLEPIDLNLPKGLQVIDDCREYDNIKRTIREYSMGSKIDLIIIDNINQINFGIKLPYKEKIKKILDILSDLSEEVSILGSFYMMESANWLEDENFSNDDEKLGGLVLVERKDKIVEIFDDLSEEVYKYTIDPRNLKLVIDTINSNKKINLPKHNLN